MSAPAWNFPKKTGTAITAKTLAGLPVPVSLPLPRWQGMGLPISALGSSVPKGGDLLVSVRESSNGH